MVYLKDMFLFCCIENHWHRHTNVEFKPGTTKTKNEVGKQAMAL